MQPILKINLSTNNITKCLIDKEWIRAYVGGASLAARLLYDYINPNIHPLSPQATLLFVNGPLTGTAGPAVGRSVVCGRSPATGLWGESNIGGFWGTELRKAGYDGLWITGASDKPIYVVINDDQIELRDASHLWGLETYASQETILAELDPMRPRVAVIGPAGERLIPFSSILSDHGRVAGRTGMGAIMGSKKIKAIVVNGSGKIPIDRPNEFNPLRKQTNRQMRDDPVSIVARATGTAGVADYFDYLGSMPKRYFQSGKMNGIDKISGSTMTETILSGVSACHACVIACGRVVTLDGKVSSTKQRKGPEYETLVGFGPNLLNNDLESIVLMGELCDRYGMDTISASNIIGLAFSLYEHGLITEKDSNGLKLQWGDMGTVESLLGQMVSGQGIGDWLSKGALSLATRVGHPELAVQVNNLEVPYHDPRGVSGMALVYATSPRGACHNQSDYFFIDIGKVETSIGLEIYDRKGGSEKAKNVAIHQNWRTAINSLVMCLFANVSPEYILDLLISVDNNYSGMTLDELILSGERGWNLKRAINIRLGLTKMNDTLPLSFKKPFEDRPEGSDGYVPDFPAMIAEYYRVRGWNAGNGYPTREKLTELCLDWVIDDIWD